MHLIFSTKDRYPFLAESELMIRTHGYLGGILREADCSSGSAATVVSQSVSRRCKNSFATSRIRRTITAKSPFRRNSVYSCVVMRYHSTSATFEIDVTGVREGFLTRFQRLIVFLQIPGPSLRSSPGYCLCAPSALPNDPGLRPNAWRD